MSEIPGYLAHLVGPGTMTNKKPEVWDYPCLIMVMVNLQGTEEARAAFEYAEVKKIPSFMKHLVGDKLKPSDRDKTQIVNGKVRRAKSPGIWILYPALCDRPKSHVTRGKVYVEKQVNSFIERFFTSTTKKDKDVEIIRL